MKWIYEHSARLAMVVLAILCLALVADPVLASTPPDLYKPWDPPNKVLWFIRSWWFTSIQLILVSILVFNWYRGDEVSGFIRLIFWVSIALFFMGVIANVLPW